MFMPVREVKFDEDEHMSWASFTLVIPLMASGGEVIILCPGPLTSSTALVTGPLELKSSKKYGSRTEPAPTQIAKQVAERLPFHFP
ncbi:hypothetical protein AVEN_258944-1 [Araneus ventricosus]|uniref:Uncharacterized protein n=1 Tax=Araneus ventricosus TaxID=182803 RepID=A0A4Y2CE05_ARAVE|nr:hypothetical protein AVEN_258944-1 [Araneus ventricosus]